MPLWKQRHLARYQKPADGEGGDLGGGSATSQAIDALGEQGGTAAEHQDVDIDQPGADQPGGDELPGDDDTPLANPRDRLASFLDELNGDKLPEDKPAAADATKTGEKPAEGAKPDDKAPEAKPDEKTPEQEEAELLAGVKSERGQERIKQVFSENKELRSEIKEFQTLVQSTGMSAEQFAQTLEFGRLMTSGTPENLRVAAGLLEQQRALIYQALGEEAPGVDLLAGHQDLKDQVDNMEITRERAVELAKFRKADSDKKAIDDARKQESQRADDFQKTVGSAAAQMDAYLKTRTNEADHQARMAGLGQRFKDPAFMQEFVTTYQPNQWVAVIKTMYEGVQIPAAPAPRQAAPRTPAGPQPIRARSASLGTPAPTGNNPLDRVAQHMESMGI